MANEETPQWKAVSRSGRLLFASSLEHEVKQWVENNFPRMHVEPGSVDAPEPDVAVRAPNGDVHAFHGADGQGWVNHSTPDTAPEATPDATPEATPDATEVSQ